MAPQPFESRVDNIENRVTQLEQQLGPADPTQPQVLPLRTEVRAEFSAVRSQIAEQGKALRAEMAEQGKSLRGEMAEQTKVLRGEIQEQGKALRTEMAEQTKVLRGEIGEQGKALRTEIAEQGDKLGAEIEKLEAKIDGQGTHMRVLHEEVLARIALTQEGRAAQPRRLRKKQ